MWDIRQAAAPPRQARRAAVGASLPPKAQSMLDVRLAVFTEEGGNGEVELKRDVLNRKNG